ncbi:MULTISPECIES: IS3 family transposase [Caproicibacterium]|uniref:IS3 family transposase n=1 Tax=Caproicibacterium argilliputei TaxID=3030016 RepID=A0AA97DB04_9FIRM|nr:IS3 family transposase [Caproicibacterium argilliputei]WOC32474.1 IS3 family transposase [Caproicibacterium argilliputei]
MKAAIKYEVIYCRSEKYPVRIMCKFFGVSRSGYYDYVKRRELLPRNTKLAGLIAECQKSCGKTYGYRRVQIWLERKKSLHFNPKTVLRIMNKYGLLSEIRRRKKYKQMGQQLHKYENVLNRNFVADRPNQKWVTDISYIHTAQGVLYLSMIRDLFDNSIVAYKTGTEQTVNLVLNTIKLAVEKEAAAGELHLHSDQGFQYTSQAYFNLTKEYGITPSMSRRGNCYDNALAENFFSILKTECIYRHKLSSFDEARQLIDEYIDFYNNERIQTKTHLTPLEKRHQVA